MLNSKNNPKKSLKALAALVAVLICLLALASCKKEEVLKGGGSSEATAVTDTAAKEPEEQGDIEYSLEHLKSAVKAWQNFTNYGAPCDLTGGIVYEEAKKYMTVEQSQWCADLRAVDCCGSIAEAKAHLAKYLDKSMYGNFSSESFVEYRGLLYVVIGGVGFVEYDVDGINADSVQRTDKDKIYLTAKEYNSGGVDYTNMRIDFEYIDGAYKITNVTEAK